MRKRILPHVDALGGAGGVQANQKSNNTDKTQGQKKSASEIVEQYKGNVPESVVQEYCNAGGSLFDIQNAINDFNAGQNSKAEGGTQTISKAVKNFETKLSNIMENFKKQISQIQQPNTQQINNTPKPNNENNAQFKTEKQTIGEQQEKQLKETIDNTETQELQPLKEEDIQEAKAQMDENVKQSIAQFGLK